MLNRWTELQSLVPPPIACFRSSTFFDSDEKTVFHSVFIGAPRQHFPIYHSIILPFNGRIPLKSASDFIQIEMES